MSAQQSSRRTVTVGATALSALASRALRAQDKPQVIVIGAGLSGLNAALHLEAGGARVTVLEASARVGGRVLTRYDLEGAPESGGKQVHDGYIRAHTRIRQLGVATYPRPKPRRGVGFNIGGVNIAPTEWPTSPANRLVGEERALPPTTLRFRIMTRINPLRDLEAWKRPENRRYDVAFKPLARSLGISEEALRLMEVHATSMGLDGVSALHLFRRQLQSATMEFGDTARYFEGGAARLPQAMAAALKGDIRHDARVVAMANDAAGVEIRCADGAIHRADFALCTIPFPALRNVALDPSPEPGLAEAIRELPAVHATYIHLLARERFWDEDGFPPSMFTDSPLEMVSKLFDEPGGRDTMALTVELRGLGCARFDALSDGERATAVTAELARLRPASAGKVAYLGTDAWALKPLFGGGYHYFKPGQVSRFAEALFKPWGRVHFAGEHLAETMVGVEAAFESGEREAKAILARL
jgi:monoamine oxidase